MVLTQDELLKEMQSRELEILQACIEVCQAHNIRYYALGGTLLGAVRHKGFIPWDDDIDIGIPRKDYQRFIEVMKNIEGFVGIHIAPNMVNYNILQVLGDEKIKYNGKYIQPFIDIFPLDGYPSSGIKKWIHSKRILWNRLLFKLSILSQVANVDRGSLENLIVKVSRALRIEKTLDTKRISHRIHQLIQCYSFDESSYVGNILGRYREREIVPSEYFGKGTNLSFHHLVVRGPEKWDAYLTQIYGEYMKLPPEQERLAHFEVE